MTDVFRKEYKPLSDAQKDAIELIKTKASELLNIFNCVENPDGRYLSLAKTELENSIMWAVKSIT